jgi:FkbM family methyltransferase
VGQYANEVRKAGYDRQIISIEPAADAFAELSTKAGKDTRWRAIHTAVGSSEGTLTLNVSEGSIFNSVLKVTDAAVTASPNAKIIRTEEVPVRTIDALLDEVGAEPAIGFKIDVQGFERDVLDGAGDALKSARLVEMELTPVAVYEGQMLLEEALATMSTAGFVLSLTENLFPEPGSGRALQFNGIFVRP